MAILVHSFAAASESVPRAPLPFHLTPQGGIIVPVSVDGGAPVPFLLDTGSNGSVISESLASSIGARIVAKTTVTSAIGQVERRVARIGRLTLGTMSATDVLATVTPALAFDVPDVGSDGTRVQGVVGQDVLSTLRYTIDYRARQIVWRDCAAPAPARATVLALEPLGDRFLVVLPQGSSTPLRLVPDSGSEGLVLFQREGGPAAAVTFAAGGIEISGLAGRGQAKLARVNALRVGSTTLNDYPAVVVARDGGAPAGDGLLPLHIFARVTFNGPERQLVIEQR